jgi:hypothetical protein
VNEISKATKVEVDEGAEVNNIDITVVKETPPKFSASGRIVDETTGLPLPNLVIEIQSNLTNDDEYVYRSSPPADAEGQFKVDDLPPGKYQMNVAVAPKSDFRSESVPFQIIDGNVTGLMVKAIKGASISGQIIFEGDENSPQFRPEQLGVIARVGTSRSGDERGLSVAPDGSFYAAGLREGTVTFWIHARSGLPKRLIVSRVERDGELQPRGFEVKDGDRVTGIKVFVVYTAGTIRGVVKFENGEMPPGGHLSVSLTNVESGNDEILRSNLVVDPRGRFVVEKVPAGTYALGVTVYGGGRERRSPPVKQQVTVIDGGVSDVTVTVDLSRKP